MEKVKQVKVGVRQLCRESAQAAICANAFLPANKKPKAISVVPAIDKAMAVMESTGSRLTPAEINPPRPIWIKPSNAEAVPAFLVKGAMHKAAAFG